MTLVIPEGYGQVNYVFSGDAAPLGAQVTLGVENAALYDADELAESCFLTFSGDLFAFVTDKLSLVEVRTKLGPNLTGPSGIFVDLSTGGDAGEAVSPNTSILVHKNTPFGGRAGSGRWYIPGLKESRVDSRGHIDGTFVEDFQEALATMYTDMTAQDVLPVVLHSETSPIEGPSTITSFTVDPIAATQRRRLR